MIVLTAKTSRYIERDDWMTELGAEHLVRTLQWGDITERRFALASGLEIEIGIGSPGWAALDPVDPGTRRVVTDGMRILHDPHGLLAALAAACQRRDPRGNPT